MNKSAAKDSLKTKIKKDIEENPFVQISPMCNHIEDAPMFTGIARTIRCYRNNGHPNFQVLTLDIVNGKVMSMDVSDAYASFEAIVRMEYWNDLSAIKLNSNWAEGKTMSR